MIKHLNRKNNHDLLHQYQWVHPLQKPKLVQCTINTTNNQLIKTKKILPSLHFFMNTFLGLKPGIKKARKSIASFKVSVNSPIGTKNDLHHSFLSSFYAIFITSILPLNYKHNKHASFKNNKMYTLLLSHGLKDFNNTFMNHTPFRYLGGAHIQWMIQSPVKNLPFYYF